MPDKIISSRRLIALTALAMIAFAGNSVLARLALKTTNIDAASFTTIRLVSGALILWLVVKVRNGTKSSGGSFLSALALFIYAAGFSFAYVEVPTGTGALLLFGAVQLTMIGHGLWAGERFSKPQSIGLLVAFAGLFMLIFPGISAPSLSESVLMAGAGIAWGIYSIRGKGSTDPIGVTAGNFLRSVPLAIIMSMIMRQNAILDPMGVWYAIISGALASGLGYVIWYLVLPLMKTTRAATVQLSVPVIAALGGVIFLGEPISLRLTLASVAILGGIAMVITNRRQRNHSQAKPAEGP